MSRVKGRYGFKKLIKEFSRKSYFSEEECIEIIDTLIISIKNTLSSGDVERIELKNLGSFIVWESKEIKRNVFGKEKVYPSYKNIRFSFSKQIRDKIVNKLKETLV